MNKTMKYSLIFLTLATILVALLIPFASVHPDGLEKVAEKLNFIDDAEELYSASPMPDYDATGKENYLGVLIAEITGIIIVLGLGLGIGTLMKKRRHAPQNS